MIILLLLGLLIVILLVVSLIFFVFKYHYKSLLHEYNLQGEKLAHQQQFIQATLQAEEIEKHRLSKNMYDEMGTYTSLLKMNVFRFSELPNQDTKTQELLKEQNNLITDMALSVRNISSELSLPALKDFGVIAGIQELITIIEKHTPVQFSFEFTELVTRFDFNLETQLFRIIKELLNNLIKNAQPNDVSIGYVSSQNFIEISMTHDGVGISAKGYKHLRDQVNGLWLKIIETRVQLLNGIISYEKENGTYLIQLKIPLKA